MQTFDVLVLTIDFAAKVKIKNKMTKEILHKILKEGTSLGINAISVEEKKAMQTFFMDFVNPAKRNVLDLKNETCKNREKRNVQKNSRTRHFKTTKKQSKTGCFYSF